MTQAAKILQIPATTTEPTSDPEARRVALLASEERKCALYNKNPGALEGLDCPECLNRGHSLYVDPESLSIVQAECACMTVRRSEKRLRDSGLSQIMDSCTFDGYEATEKWQVIMKNTAQGYLSDHAGKWLAMLGQPGSGKTHLCTAVAVELMRRHSLSLHYMPWMEEATRAKGFVTDGEEYCAIVNPIKTAGVLYIDDFWKTPNGEQPTKGDKKLAAEIVNYRYNNPRLITIISSEYSALDMIDIEESVGSRIYERTKDFCLVIDRDRNKNYRLRKSP